MAVQLMVLSVAQVQEIIRLAEIKDAKGSQGHTAKSDDISLSSPHYIEWQHLAAAIDQLPPIAKAELLALAWAGQGRIGERWDELVQAATSREEGKDLTLQITMMETLNKYLIRGLDLIDHMV